MNLEPLKGLDRLPSAPKHDHHIWVDYVELLCLTNYSDFISKADIADHLGERRDLGELTGQDEFDEMPPAEANDFISNRIDDLFAHLAYRSAVFDSAYPFELGMSRATLERRAELSDQQRLYVFFLLASSLRYVNATESSVLTSNFELLSREALEVYLPSTAQVHVFGTSSSSTDSPRYTGNTFAKISKLAEDLFEKVVLDSETISPHSSGDAGLDIVAWIPMGDDHRGMLIVFGQCACTDDWIHKQHTSNAATWRKKISIEAPPGNFVFVPFFFRRVNGEWQAAQDIVDSVLVDRLRMIYLLRDKLPFFVTLPAAEVVVRAANQRRDIF